LIDCEESLAAFFDFFLKIEFATSGSLIGLAFALVNSISLN
jgi:hypothetical protein